MAGFWENQKEKCFDVFVQNVDEKRQAEKLGRQWLKIRAPARLNRCSLSTTLEAAKFPFCFTAPVCIVFDI